MKTQIIFLSTLLLLFVVAFCATNQKKTERTYSIFEETEAEKPEITLISVFDNYQVNPEMKTSWGFSSVIKTPTENILFDTGSDSDILLSNMQKMNIDPKSIDKVFISHVHGDHLGGLEGFLEENSDVTVFIPGSFPNSVRNMITNKGAKFKAISDAEKVTDFAWSTGEISGPPKEHSLMLNSKKGLIVMTGCAHPGIVRIVKRAKKLTKKDSAFLVLGGFHHPPQSIIQEFKKIGVKKAAPSHCTGDKVRNAFAKEYGEDFIEWGVGKILEVD